jgi:large subunit ribosomal protein L23
MNIFEILKRPLMTEKSTAMNERGVYVFEVDRRATKDQIKAAVKDLYPEIDVVCVRTSIIAGKPKYRHTKSGIFSGRTATTKKAYVQLAQDQLIDVFAND